MHAKDTGRRAPRTEPRPVIDVPVQRLMLWRGSTVPWIATRRSLLAGGPGSVILFAEGLARSCETFPKLRPASTEGQAGEFSDFREFVIGAPGSFSLRLLPILRECGQNLPWAAMVLIMPAPLHRQAVSRHLPPQRGAGTWGAAARDVGLGGFTPGSRCSSSGETGYPGRWHMPRTSAGPADRRGRCSPGRRRSRRARASVSPARP